MSIQLFPSCVYVLSPENNSIIDVAVVNHDHPIAVKYVFDRRSPGNQVGDSDPSGQIDSGGLSNLPIQDQELEPGQKFLMAGYFNPETPEGRGNSFTVKFGVGDGHSRDFGENVAADLELLFGNESTSGPSRRQGGPGHREPPVHPEALLSEESVLDLSSIAPNTSTSVKITIPANPRASASNNQNSHKIEQSVIIHILNANHNLLYTMSLLRNQEVTVSVSDQPSLNSIGEIKILALADIKTRVDNDQQVPDRTKRENKPNGAFEDSISFRIGDPITDASVKVSSRNP
jgi:hypothetical protein